MFKKIIALFVVLVLGLFAFVGCGKDEKDDDENKVDKFWDNFTNVEVTKVDTKGYDFVNPGKLTVAVSTDFAPFEFVDLTKQGQEKFAGSDIALAKKIAEALGLELNIKAMDFDATMVSLDNEIADIAISGFSYTVSRAASYLYSECYYDEGDGGQVIVIKKSDETKYTTIESMNVEGVKIAGQNGALQQNLVTQFTPNATLVKIDDLNAAYDQLKSGALDGVAVAETVAKTIVASNSDLVIMAEPFDFKDSGSFALMKKGNTALAELINPVIKEIVAKDAYKEWVKNGDALFQNLGSKAGELIPEEE